MHLLFITFLYFGLSQFSKQFEFTFCERIFKKIFCQKLWNNQDKWHPYISLILITPFRIIQKNAFLCARLLLIHPMHLPCVLCLLPQGSICPRVTLALPLHSLPYVPAELPPPGDPMLRAALLGISDIRSELVEERNCWSFTQSFSLSSPRHFYFLICPLTI